ncbi:helix-turn-helix domain-containing protein [Kitasatospora aureofaciens]|uniref:helix-turn-helix domain-containing protein n=1 Tax=Kitasatospora aureofaciens TaxID=1894 RepID=UPI003818046F
MKDFASRAREALAAKGMSARAASRALRYDPAYLSRVLNGKQDPSPQLADALDDLLDLRGTLSALAPGNAVMPAAPEPPEGVEGEIFGMRASARLFLDHDNRFGGDHVAHAAVQVWRAAQRRLDSGTVPSRSQGEYLKTVAELAEVSGWLLYDADQPTLSRSAFMEALMLARQAGDRPMEWFALDMLAMLAVHQQRPGEALRIADEILSRTRIPPRVVLLARIRKARALAQTGDRARTLTELDAARGALNESIASRDPSWAWWVNERELAGHQGESYLSLGDPAAAMSGIQRALDLSRETASNGRREISYSAALLEAAVRAQAWRDGESVMVTMPPLLEVVSSGRSRHRLRATLGEIVRAHHAPAWLSDLAHDVASVPSLTASIVDSRA